MWFTGVAGITGVRVIGTVELKKLQLRFREVGGILTQLFGYLSAQIVTSDFDVLNLTSLTRPEISQGICRFFLIDHCWTFSFQNWTKKILSPAGARNKPVSAVPPWFVDTSRCQP